MVKLKSNSFDWALEHIKNEGDTDIFPRAFEINAIAARWSDVRAELVNIDVEKYNWVGGRRIIIPKGKYSFRAATQLDPIDTLMLTAMIYEYGEEIEKNRISLSDKRVFSHRFKPSSDYSLYDKTINWNLFWEDSIEKAEKIKDGYVLIADVADYYNQIYHHTLENELSNTGLPDEIIKSIKYLFSRLTHTVSRGIPVGPHATHLLAEICFNPIDYDLISQGFDFCRYVDDMHFFCESKDEAEITLWDLADTLDTQLQLVLQRSKIEIMPVNEFIDLAKKKVNDQPSTDIEKDILKVIDNHSSGEPYKSVDFSKLSAAEKEILSQDKIESVLKEYLKKSNITRIKWIIRRISQIGAPGAVPFLINNMMNLISAIGDISKYFVSAEDTLEEIDEEWDSIGKQLVSILELPLIKHSSFLKMTIINLFSKISDLDNINYLTRRYDDEGSYFVKRKIIKAATKAGNNHWLYRKRTEFDSADPWLRRAIILGSSTFPPDQKKHWLINIKRRKLTLLEKTVVEWVENGGTI